MLPIGQTVYLWRCFRHLTQQDLARKSGISRPNLSMIEQGGRDLTVQTLRRLAQALEVNPGVLVDGIFPEEFKRQTGETAGGFRKENFRFTRRRLDRIARWLAAQRSPGKDRPELSPEESEIAEGLKSLIKRRLKVAEKFRHFFPRSVRKEKENFLKAKIRLTSEELKNLLNRVGKLSERNS